MQEYKGLIKLSYCLLAIWLYLSYSALFAGNPGPKWWNTWLMCDMEWTPFLWYWFCLFCKQCLRVIKHFVTFRLQKGVLLCTCQSREQTIRHWQMTGWFSGQGITEILWIVPFFQVHASKKRNILVIVVDILLNDTITGLQRKK